jgi:hypothetical protein
VTSRWCRRPCAILAWLPLHGFVAVAGVFPSALGESGHSCCRCAYPNARELFWAATSPSSTGGGFGVWVKTLQDFFPEVESPCHSPSWRRRCKTPRPSFGSSSSARVSSHRRVPLWAVVLERWRYVGVDKVVLSPVQHKTRLPASFGSSWRFGLTFCVVFSCGLRCVLCASVCCNRCCYS